MDELIKKLRDISESTSSGECHCMTEFLIDAINDNPDIDPAEHVDSMLTEFSEWAIAIKERIK